MKIVHLTTVHQRYDTRIFLKMCRSLAAAGHDVTLVAADGKGNETRDGVKIVDACASRGRIDRVVNGTKRVRHIAAKLDAELYHLHDPELLPAALLLKRQGKRVIFDSHEDIPQDILTKAYIPRPARRPMSMAAAVMLKTTCRRLDGVVAATPFIRDSFRAMGIRCVDINNFPILGELASPSTGWDHKQSEVCYVGGITNNRGAVEIVRAIAETGARLNLVGSIGAELKNRLSAETGWSKVNNLGFLDRRGVRDVLSRSTAGLVTLHPVSTFIDSLPIKMFEYMSAGIPVIASNFPLWREIVEDNECGLVVDPLDPAAIAAAIDRLVANPGLACRMGENGRRSVTERYNWAIEEKKLLAFCAA